MAPRTASERAEALRRHDRSIALNGGYNPRSMRQCEITGRWSHDPFPKCSCCPAEIPEGVCHWIGDAPICKACIPTATAKQVRA